MPSDIIKTATHLYQVLRINVIIYLVNSNNYKFITMSLSFLCYIQFTILHKCEYILSTCDNQFRCKREHSTELCISTKIVFDYYKQNNVTIFVAAKLLENLILDATLEIVR